MTTRVRTAGAAWLAAVLVLPALASAEEISDADALYFMGTRMGQQLKQQYGFLSQEELDHLKRGIDDAIAGVEKDLDDAMYREPVQTLLQARRDQAVGAEKAAAAAYVAKMAAEDGAVKTASGIVYRELAAGEGASPTASDRVKVHYHGTFRDGEVFDSSVERGEPAEFRLSGVIKCWTEALQKMKPGGKAKITCPPDLAYGDRGAPPRIPGGAALTFEVELIEVEAPAQ